MNITSALVLVLTFLSCAFSKNCPSKKFTAKLFCYYSKISDIDGCKCSHVILPANTSIVDVERIKKDLGGTKILITVTEFNEATVNLVKNSKVDGAEINLRKLKTKTDLNDFISTIKNKLGNNLIIAVNVPAKPEVLAKFFDFKGLSKTTDYFILQTAFLGASANVTFHPSRLSGIWDIQNTDSVIDLVTGMGAPLSKLVITTPIQAYQFTLQDEKHTAPGSPALNVKSLTRDQFCQLMSNGEKWTLERDQDQAGPYIFRKESWIAFDDKISIDIKTKYVRVRGLAGIALKDMSLDGGKKCGSTILETTFNGFASQARAPRGAVLHSLEREILDTPNNLLTSVQISPFRISRVIDVEGHIHVVRQDTRTEFECARQGFFVHPRSCNRFYRCVKFDQSSDEFSVFEFDCPTGLTFDEKVEVCVWPGSLPHGSPCSGSSEIAPVPRNRFSCPSKPGYYVDPENCRWFFACMDHGDSHMSAYEFRCPYGLVFDEEKLLCEWPWFVPKCQQSGVIETTDYYGGMAAFALNRYEGLGQLKTVTLGGLSGTITEPEAKVYSNIGTTRISKVNGGSAHLIGLDESKGRFIGVTGGGNLSAKLAQSLANAGFLKQSNIYAINVNNGLHGGKTNVGKIVYAQKNLSEEIQSKNHINIEKNDANNLRSLYQSNIDAGNHALIYAGGNLNSEIPTYDRQVNPIHGRYFGSTQSKDAISGTSYQYHNNLANGRANSAEFYKLANAVQSGIALHQNNIKEEGSEGQLQVKGNIFRTSPSLGRGQGLSISINNAKTGGKTRQEQIYNTGRFVDTDPMAVDKNISPKLHNGVSYQYYSNFGSKIIAASNGNKNLRDRDLIIGGINQQNKNINDYILKTDGRYSDDYIQHNKDLSASKFVGTASVSYLDTSNQHLSKDNLVHVTSYENKNQVTQAAINEKKYNTGNTGDISQQSFNEYHNGPKTAVYQTSETEKQNADTSNTVGNGYTGVGAQTYHVDITLATPFEQIQSQIFQNTNQAPQAAIDNKKHISSIGAISQQSVTHYHDGSNAAVYHTGEAGKQSSDATNIVGNGNTGVDIQEFQDAISSNAPIHVTLTTPVEQVQSQNQATQTGADATKFTGNVGAISQQSFTQYHDGSKTALYQTDETEKHTPDTINIMGNGYSGVGVQEYNDRVTSNIPVHVTFATPVEKVQSDTYQNENKVAQEVIDAKAFSSNAKAISQQSFTQYHDGPKSVVHQSYETGEQAIDTINIVGNGYSGVGATQDGIISRIPVHVTLATPVEQVQSYIPVVTAVPIPSIKTFSTFENYKGGVIANVPHLQYKYSNDYKNGTKQAWSTASHYLNLELDKFKNITYSTDRPTLNQQLHYVQLPVISKPVSKFSISSYQKPLVQNVESSTQSSIPNRIAEQPVFIVPTAATGILHQNVEYPGHVSFQEVHNKANVHEYEDNKSLQVTPTSVTTTEKDLYSYQHPKLKQGNQEIEQTVVTSYYTPYIRPVTDSKDYQIIEAGSKTGVLQTQSYVHTKPSAIIKDINQNIQISTPSTNVLFNHPTFMTSTVKPIITHEIGIPRFNNIWQQNSNYSYAAPLQEKSTLLIGQPIKTSQSKALGAQNSALSYQQTIQHYSHGYPYMQPQISEGQHKILQLIQTHSTAIRPENYLYEKFPRPTTYRPAVSKNIFRNPATVSYENLPQPILPTYFYQKPSLQEQEVLSNFNYDVSSAAVKPNGEQPIAGTSYRYGTQFINQDAKAVGYTYPKPKVTFEEQPVPVEEVPFVKTKAYITGDEGYQYYQKNAGQRVVPTPEQAVVNSVNYENQLTGITGTSLSSATHKPETVNSAVITSYFHVTPSLKYKGNTGYSYPKPGVPFEEFKISEAAKNRDYASGGESYEYFQQNANIGEQIQAQQEVVNYDQVEKSTPTSIISTTPAPTKSNVLEPAIVTNYFHSKPSITEVVKLSNNYKQATLPDDKERAPVVEEPFVRKEAYITGGDFDKYQSNIDQVVPVPTTSFARENPHYTSGKSYQYFQQNVGQNIRVEDKPQPVEEIPFVKQIAYITGTKFNEGIRKEKLDGYVYTKPVISYKEKPVVIENYQAPQIVYNQEKSTSTPKPTYSTIASILKTNKVVPTQQVYSYDSRWSTNKQIVSGKQSQTPDIIYSQESDILSTPQPTYSTVVDSVTEFEKVSPIEQIYGDEKENSQNKVNIESSTNNIQRKFHWYDSRLTTKNPKVFVQPTHKTISIRPVVKYGGFSEDQYHTNNYEKEINIGAQYLPSKNDGVFLSPNIVESYIAPAYKGTLSITTTSATPAETYFPSTVSTTENNNQYLPPITKSPTYIENYEYRNTRKPAKVIKIIRPIQNYKTVVKENDFHPVLSTKLGAQCTCVSPTIKLKQKTIALGKGSSGGNEGVIAENHQYEPQKEIFVENTVQKDDTISDKEIVKAVRTGLKLVKQAAKEGANEGTKEALASKLLNVRNQGIVCERVGLFRHPFQCNKFYECRWDCTKNKYTLHIFNCPVHLTFDNSLGACNWPSQGPTCMENTLLPNE